MARNDVFGSLPGGRVGNVSEYDRSLEGTRQNQLKAQALGLDMQQYEFYRRSPSNYINQHKANFDSTTGKFNIPDIIPGALISNGGPVRGPNGMILAAGTTPNNPVDLATIKPVTPITGAGHSADTQAWISKYLMPPGQRIDDDVLARIGGAIDPRPSFERGGGDADTFLPPYLQPGQPGGVTPAVPPVAPITPPGSPLTPFVPPGTTLPGSPLTPFVPQGIPGQLPLTPGFPMAVVPRAGFGGGFAQTAKLLELPYYLRSFGTGRAY